jgi:hypothetical protein
MLGLIHAVSGSGRLLDERCVEALSRKAFVHVTPHMGVERERLLEVVQPAARAAWHVRPAYHAEVFGFRPP